MSNAELENDEMETDLELGAEGAKNLAAAATVNGVPKNFRQQADMEAFYRFVHDNDLREEALTILDSVRTQKAALKAAKRVKH